MTLFGRIRDALVALGELWPSDLVAGKAMALLGPAAFGPICSSCGKRDWRGMHPRHYAYANQLSLRMNGVPFCRLPAVCQCRPEDEA